MSDASSNPTPAAGTQAATTRKPCQTKLNIEFDPGTLALLKPMELRDMAAFKAYFDQQILGGLVAEWDLLLASELPSTINVNTGSNMPTQAQMQAVMDAALVAFNTKGFAVRLSRASGSTASTCWQLVWENGRWVWKSCDDLVAELPSAPGLAVSPIPASLSTDPNNPAKAMLRCTVSFDPTA